MEFSVVRASERACPAARADSGAKQAFIRVDISHAVQQLLVEQCCLDRRLAPLKELHKLFPGDLQRLSARTGKTGAAHLQAAKPPWIDKTQLSSRRQLRDQVGVA